jgi:oligoendopeptidase F
MPSQNTADNAVRWNLTSIYSEISDPQIDLDIAEFTKQAQQFSLNYKGKLAEKLGAAISDFAELDMLGGKILVYLSLQQSLDVTNETVKAKIAEAQQTMSQVQGEYLTFFELELVALDDVTLEKWYASDSEVQRHRPWIEHQRVFKPHFLSEPVEAALTKRAPFGPSSWDEFFERYLPACGSTEDDQ